MPNLLLLFGALVGCTVLLFPQKWKTIFAKLSFTEWERKGWRKASLHTVRFTGAALIAFVIIVKVFYQ